MNKKGIEEHELHHHKKNNTDFILNNLPSRLEFEELSLLLSLLSDPTRLQIFWILANSEECVFNIAQICSISSPLVSFHLRFLKQSKIITSSRIGKEVHYKLSDSKEAKILKEVCLSLLDSKKEE